MSKRIPVWRKDQRLMRLSDLDQERTVTLALPAALDRALELVAAKRGWSKKETVAWALMGRAEVRAELAPEGKGRK